MEAVYFCVQLLHEDQQNQSKNPQTHARQYIKYPFVLILGTLGYVLR